MTDQATLDSAVDVVENPWTGSTTHRRHSTAAELDAAIESAHRAFGGWAQEPTWRRAELLRQAADAVETHSDELVGLLIDAIGKPRRAAKVEVRRTAAVFRMCADALLTLGGSTIPADTAAGGEDKWSLTFRVPYGVVALITPFNAPLNLLSQKLAPALAVGNTAVIKPSPEGGAVSDRFQEILAPFFGDVIQVVHGGPALVQELVGDTRVRAVSLTGGLTAGEAVLRAAGVKPVYLELGSNSPNIVLADADVERAAQQIARAAFEASGQQCISAQRVLVARDVVEDFTRAFVSAAEGLVVGDPNDESTDVGPMIHSRGALRVAEMISEAEARGARVILDGRAKALQNARLLGPTILADVPVHAEVMREEVFGPVVSLVTVADLDEAIRIANDVPGLLQASCFTNSLTSGMRAARELWAGSVWINEATRFRLDTYPFGGTGTSGIGREGIVYALESYSQLKHVGMGVP